MSHCDMLASWRERCSWRVLPAVIQQAATSVVVRPGPPLLADSERLAAILAVACHLGAWLERELTQPVRGDSAAVGVLAFAQRHLTEQPSLAALATFLGVSVSTASRRVRELHDCTWPALVTRLRIERAERLMRDTDLPLAQIAMRCGLTDASHLHRLFRRQHACTPQHWREQARLDGSVPGIA
jgi:AraC-like DNA-binding protein